MRRDLNAPRRRYLLGWLLALYWIALFMGTHSPVPPSEVALPEGSDKLIHFVAYFGLACLLGLFRGTQKWASSFAIIAVFAMIDELLQIPVGRSCDVADGLADWLGAAIGIVLATRLQAR